MKVKIWATEKIDTLASNLEKRVEKLEVNEDHIEAETDDTEFLERTPGVEKYSVSGEERDGIGGSPVNKQAYAKIESREDAVKALLATIQGYDLRILDTGREWDLRQLKKHNPDIKHLKFSEPQELLEIDTALFETEELEEVDVDMPGEEETLIIYREMLT